MHRRQKQNRPARANRRKGASNTRPTPRWQVVENVVAAIERVRATVPGIVVRQKVQVPTTIDPGETRDVDVLVTIPVQGRTLSIGVEVKSGRRPISKDEMGALVDLKNDVQLDRFCVVSTSGFSVAALSKAKRNGIETARLRDLASGQVVTEHGVEVLRADFDFADESTGIAAPLLDGVQAQEILVRNSRGEGALHVFLENQGLHAVRLLEKEERRELGDCETFRLVVKMDQPETSVFARGRMLPQARAIVADFRIRRRQVTERWFDFLGIAVAAWEGVRNGERVQMTLVSVPTADNPNLKRLHLSVAAARPKRERFQ